VDVHAHGGHGLLHLRTQKSTNTVEHGSCVHSTHEQLQRVRTSSGPRSSSAKNRFATEYSASSGHAMNQSIVQQLISDGNWRQRTRKESPTGDMASTMCRLSRTREMNKRYTLSRVSGMP
jgi:hypothetical protein